MMVVKKIIMKSPYSKRKHAILLALTKCKKADCKNIYSTFEADTTDVVCDICNNILNGNIKISKKQANELYKHKKALEMLTNKQVNKSVKKNIIKQKGGFIIPIIASVIGSVISLLK
jgi:ribosomal protein S27E